jgi:hypothetical protein
MLPLPVLLKRIVSVLSLVVEGGNAILCHPLVTALQFHGIWLVVLLGTLWVIAGKARLREVQRQRRHALERRLGNSNSHGIPASLADEQEVRRVPQLHRRLCPQLPIVTAKARPSCRLARPSCRL